MTRTERDYFIKWAINLSDAEVEKQYYNCVFDSLGSEAEEMYERGWNIDDVMEREKYERDLYDKANILEFICIGRGIQLWKNGDNL